MLCFPKVKTEGEAFTIKEIRLWQAVWYNDLSTVKRFAEDPEVNVNSVDPVTHITIFYRACALGSPEIVQYLLSNPRVNVKFKYRGGETPFYFACLKGRTEIVKILLADRRIDVNAKDKNGNTPFYSACGQNRTEVIKVLLKDPRVNINTYNKKGVTPLYLVSFHGYTEVVAMLLSDPRTKVNRRQQDMATAFFIACQLGHLDVVKLLLADPRTEVNIPMRYEISPLWIASQFGYLDIIQHILGSGRKLEVAKKSIWNNRTAAQHARAQAVLEKLDDETEKEYQQRIRNCPLIVELLESYQYDPKSTRDLLRCSVPALRQLYAAEVFALIVLLGDDYLKFRKSSMTQTKRFFSICSRLPQELQMTVCCKVFEDPRKDALIEAKQLALALKRLYHELLNPVKRRFW